ncbi:MAG: ABC transporter ATP-binding protein [Thiogranum sp.]|nr:ABC transporter ATP-binding protein [Thiogranum sp.]
MADQTSPPLLRCIDTTVTIAGMPVTRQLNMAIEAGQCWCILGRNGAGKTTLLHTLAGLRAANAGRIECLKLELHKYRRRQLARHLGVLLQDQESPFPVSVLETVLQGRHPHLHTWQWETAADVEIARQALSMVGLESFDQRNIQTLSGGERQRAAIAALLAQDTQLLLLDEPTSHLDLHHRIQILERLVQHCRDSSRALVLVLHDINLAARFADRALLLLGDGVTLHGEADEVLQTGTLERLFGHPLVAVETRVGRAWLPA